MAWYKDPLLFFLLVGALIYAASQWAAQNDDEYNIIVGEADVQRISDQWSMQMRRPPNSQELQGLVDQFIREEIYYREALRMGLDANDTIVRRRMVQKLTFLTEDIATSAAFTEGDLQAFYQDNLANYQLAERYSFKHRYFSLDRRGNARADATAALADTTITGDPFMLQREYALRSEREIGDLFGRQFATSLVEMQPQDSWQGPIQSAYGWHVILLTDKRPASVQPFTSVRERVLSDAQQVARDEANTRYFEELRAQYNIVYADPAP
jgi:parvulin-like peptidyl-prolyl isomerase